MERRTGSSASPKKIARGNFVFCQRLAGQNDRLKTRRKCFRRLHVARAGIKRLGLKRTGRSVLGRRQIAAWPAVATSSAALAAEAAIVAPAASSAVIAIKSARPAVAILFERRTAMLPGRSRRRAGIRARCASGAALQDFALKRNYGRRIFGSGSSGIRRGRNFSRVRMNMRSMRGRFGNRARFADSAIIDGGGREYFRALMLLFLGFFGRSGHVVVVFQMLEEIADVQEGVAIQANIHEGRLHPGENSCNAAFVEAAD